MGIESPLFVYRDPLYCTNFQSHFSCAYANLCESGAIGYTLWSGNNSKLHYSSEWLYLILYLSVISRNAVTSYARMGL